MLPNRKQPPTTRGIRDGEIARLIDQAKWNLGASRALETVTSVASLPGEIGLQLTNRCNLRCVHCFQWGKDGHYHLHSKQVQQQELDIALIENALVETRSTQSRLYVWGGEPLVYRKFAELMNLVSKERRWTTICTNGIGVEKKFDALLPASDTVVMLVSLDGFERQNDAMRTSGAFEKTVQSIRSLVKAQKEGAYRGQVSIAAVISDDLIDELYEFTEFVESLGIDTLHLNFPWYISKESARRMDAFYEKNFSWLRDLGLHVPAAASSWHGYTYKLSADRLDHLHAGLARLYERPWNIRVKVQPLMSGSEIENFIQGAEAPPAGRSRCVSIATRLSVLPDGKVTTCKLFPEFTVGDLKFDSVANIWNGEPASRTRRILAQGLTPVCSRCVQLYLNRPKQTAVALAHA